MFAKLKGLEGESGAKSLLMQSNNQLQTIKMDNAKFDIDYPEDLAKIRL
jgi:CTP:molybdopterin cytidylyltransferase MocA